ncbi:MAG TPA: hypothetical protein VK629_13355 [Steroidobacteraceae bacterium]|nr:hypothetical protein [Steroidobacteraceae bacterium]
MDTRVTIEVLPTAAVTPALWNHVWSITREFFDTDRDFSETKLKEYQSIALFWTHGDRKLIGTASIDVYPVSFRKRRLVVIYTTHVLLREEYRGHNLLQRLGLRTFLKTRLRFPFSSIYWFFDTFSYKSYLLLPRNFRKFWPRLEHKTPDRERDLINQLATKTYGESWRPQFGIVTRSGKKRLKPDVAPLNRNVPLTPELRFFSTTNPGHAEGDMLVCLCPLTLANWFSVGVSALRRIRKPKISSTPTQFS